MGFVVQLIGVAKPQQPLQEHGKLSQSAQTWSSNILLQHTVVNVRFMLHYLLVRPAGDTAGEIVTEPTEQQQGGGEVIENPDASDAPENPDGYLAEEGGTEAEVGNESEAMQTKD